jgi:hypothetical protein
MMDNLFIEPFQRFIERIAAFLPSILIGLVIIFVGLIIAWLLRKVVSKIAQILNIDRVSDRLGIAQILQKSGYKEPLSRMIGQMVFWIVLISFIIIGLDALKMPAVEDLLTEFLLYLPNIIVSVNAGIAFSGLVGKFVKFTVFIMASTMALELLGIGEDTVLIAFAVVFGGVVLALAIAFGLGGKDAAKGYIDRMVSEKKEDDDIHHI